MPEPRSGLVFGLSGRDNALMGAHRKYGQNRKKCYQNAVFQSFFFQKVQKKIIDSAATNLDALLNEKNKLIRKLLVFMSGVSPAAEV